MMDKIGHRIVISFVSQISAGEAREGKQIPALLFTLNCCFTLPNHCSFHKRWCHMGCKHLQMSWTKSNLVYKSQQHSVSLVFLILFCHCSLHKKIKSCHHLLYMLFLIIYLLRMTNSYMKILQNFSSVSIKRRSSSLDGCEGE